MGDHNTITDSLSRFQIHRFRKEAPQADTIPTPLPLAVWDFF